MADLILIPPQSAAVLALKSLWREYPALSCCAPLAGKLAALESAKAGASPIEANYVGQGYALPTGLSWADVATLRANGAHPAQMVPLAVAPGCIAWGVPIVAGEYLLHPGNIGGAL